MDHQDIIIDPEFRDLIQPLSDDELRLLEENVLRDGITDPLKVWRGENVLLDGHNRYDLARRHGLGYEVTYLDFGSRDEAMLWEINNQLGRRNLDAVYRMDLADKRRDILAAQARERQSQAGGDRKSERYKASHDRIASVKNDRSDFSPQDDGFYQADIPIEVVHVPPAIESPKQKTTRERIADAAGVSTGQMAQYEQLKKKRPDLLQKARDRELTVGGAYAAMKKDEKKRAKAEEVRQAQSYIESQHGEGSSVLHVGDSIGLTVPCDLLLTDPPYSTDVGDVGAFVASWLYAALDGVRPDGFAYVFVGAYPDELRAYLDADTPDHISLCQVLVWTYRNTLGNNPNDRYKQNWQAILFYRGTDAPDLDCPLTSEQWAVQDVNAPDGRQGDRLHAWQKPLELCERLIRHSTRKGDTVYDPFACTGTTLVAAARLGRHGVGYEIDVGNAEIAYGRGVGRDQGVL